MNVQIHLSINNTEDLDLFSTYMHAATITPAFMSTLENKNKIEEEAKSTCRMTIYFWKNFTLKKMAIVLSLSLSLLPSFKKIITDI